jgi:hypothetical protein
MEEAKPGRPVAQSALVGAVFDAWDDLDRALDGIDSAVALHRWEDGNGSSFAWTLAHATELVDSWINCRFQDLPAHQLIGQPQFRAGGSGIADDWPALLTAVQEVRERAATFLAPLNEVNLSRSIPYTGSVRGVRDHGRLPLRYALIRIIAHHYLHIGEIELNRRQSGIPVSGDFPGQLYATLDGERTA